MTPSTPARFSTLHALARSTLAHFGIEGARLKLLRHEHNTTFQVDANSESRGGRFILRINRPGVHDAHTIQSEMRWLEALHKETDVGAPTPVKADGLGFVATVTDPASGLLRHGVLLRWQPGRFVSDRLTPRKLAAVAALQARLHRHAQQWVRPASFRRPRVDTLTNEGKRASISAQPMAAPGPSGADVDLASSLVRDLIGDDALAVVQRALAQAGRASAEVDAMQGGSTLIHADLHYENFLFDKGVARAIDFDDCGWGSRLYDISITLWELKGRADYPALRDAFIAEYRRHLDVPDNHAELVDGLLQLRRVQILLWILQSRDHPAFAADWRKSAAQELDAIRQATLT